MLLRNNIGKKQVNNCNRIKSRTEISAFVVSFLEHLNPFHKLRMFYLYWPQFKKTVVRIHMNIILGIAFIIIKLNLGHVYKCDQHK